MLKARVRDKGEKWHVLPRALGGTDTDDNIVFLTPREHYVCYKILCITYPDTFQLYCEKLPVT